MLDLIVANRDWLFSGLGVVVLVGMYQWLSNRRRATESPSVSVSSPISIVLAAPSGSQVASLPKSVETDSVTAGLTPHAILNAIGDAPLLQRQDVAKHYKGVVVEWSGEVTLAQMTEKGNVRLIVRTGERAKTDEKVLAIFEVPSVEHPGLGLIKAQHKVRVRGTIREIGRYGSFCVELDNATLLEW